MEHINKGVKISLERLKVAIEANGQDKESRLAEEEAEKSKLIEARLKGSGIPVKCLVERNSFKTFVESGGNGKAVEALKEFSKAPGRSTVIVNSTSGLGKTHLACSVIRALPLERLYDFWTDPFNAVRYVSMQDICVRIDCSRFYGASETKEQIYKEYANCPLLVVDELGTGEDRRTESNFIAYVLSKRYEGMKPTLIFSNLGTEEMKDFFSDRIKDRIREVGSMYMIKGESFRKR